MKRFGLILCFAAVTSLAGCQGAEQKLNDFAVGASGVVYAVDNRVEADPADVRSKSVAMLVRRNYLRAVNSDIVSMTGPRLKEKRQLCDGQRFAEQTAAGFCSGVLIARDLVLTAGHCVKTAEDCASVYFAFGVTQQDFGGNRDAVMSVSRLYKCSKIAARESPLESENAGFYALDYAVVQLDRDVDESIPVATFAATSPAGGTVIEVLGHPNGLSMKSSSGKARPYRPHHKFIHADIDTFSGDSGAPVYAKGGSQVAGIVIGGEADYEFDQAAGCWKTKVCEVNGVKCRGERVLRVQALQDSAAFKTAVPANRQTPLPRPAPFSVRARR